MKNFICFYFSGTGNTMWAAQKLCDSLNKLDLQAAAYSIENIPSSKAAELIKSADILGLAWPIYGSDMPVIMKRFIHTLPPAEGKPLLTMCTQLMFSGDGAYVMHRKLKEKGYRYMWCRQILMPDNAYFPGLPLYPTPNYERHEKRYLQKAGKKLDRLAAFVAQGKKSTPATDSVSRALGFITQRYWYEKFVHKQMQQYTGIDKMKCTSCGLCAKLCPGDVIHLNNGLPEFDQNKCIVCMRCYNFCPAKAITINGKPFNGKKATAYKGPTREIYRKILNQKSNSHKQ